MSEATVERTHWGGRLWRRWPTALAIPLAILTLSGDDVENAVTEILPLLPLEYLIIAKLRRRQLAWPVVLVLLAATVGLMEQDAVPTSSVIAGLALVVLGWSAVDRQLFRDGELQIQALGMLGFGVVALIGLAIDPDIARYVVAAGWLLHGIWDFVHIWRDKVVPRSYAEWCGVLDLLIAFGLIFLL